MGRAAWTRSGKVDGRDRAAGLLKTDIVLLDDGDLRAPLGEFCGGEHSDQPAADDDNVRCRHYATRGTVDRMCTRPPCAREESVSATASSLISKP